MSETLQEQPSSPPKKEMKKIKRGEAVSFFRIWFGLKKADFGKTTLGSFAAAMSGVSKPMFGYFIMTIGVAYYKQDARKRVGQYSLMFTAVGFLTLVSQILQHYFYGMVGEMATRNFREALFSGTPLQLFMRTFILITSYPNLCYNFASIISSLAC